MSDLIDRLRHPVYRLRAGSKGEPDFEVMQAERIEAAAELARLRACIRLYCLPILGASILRPLRDNTETTPL